MRVFRIILMGLAAAFAGCSRAPAKISLANHSDLTVSNIYISGEHFAVPVGSMSPGMTTSFRVAPQTDKVWVVFEANGQKFDSRGKERPIFFEISPEHSLALTIGADLKVIPSIDTNSH